MNLDCSHVTYISAEPSFDQNSIEHTRRLEGDDQEKPALHNLEYSGFAAAYFKARYMTRQENHSSIVLDTQNLYTDPQLSS